MKVNTDSLILGSWASTNNAKRILDIGTGSGILALMLAQKSPQETTVDAIEIDDSAAEQASQNFANAPWSNRMQVVHTDLAHFQPSHLYDLIITNPRISTVQNRQPMLIAHKHPHVLLHVKCLVLNQLICFNFVLSIL
ncbi:methyltransferase [Alteromonas gracilis]|uniref:methyltransferase n=1 Tax=Alteromonas gracilis TaxID=1479524 RepID=UPI0032199BFF